MAIRIYSHRQNITQRNIGLARSTRYLLKKRNLSQERLFAARLPGSMPIGRQARIDHCTKPHTLADILMNKPEDDSALIIQLIRYDILNAIAESYYFLEMSTLQVTRLLDKNTLINSIEIYSYNTAGEYLSIETINSFNTIDIFNNFFLYHDYYISDCNLELANGLKISSHDDGEVSIEIPTGSTSQNIISNIFEVYNLSNSLFSHLKSKQGQYILIDQNSAIIKAYETFDDYLEDVKL